MGCFVGSSVGCVVGSFVGCIVGSSVGCVGSFVGCIVGSSVGSSEGWQFGEAVFHQQKVENVAQTDSS